MNSHYSLINKCLEVLRRCSITSMQKLRLEVQLFKVKLLLLSDKVSGGTKRSICSEGRLLEIYQLLLVVDGEGSVDALEAATRQLREIEVELSRAGC